jgi:hypothetical protein
MTAPRPSHALPARVLPAVLLLLAAAGATAGNRAPRVHGPAGDTGACTEASAATDDAGPAPIVPAASAAKAAPAAIASKPSGSTHIKPVVTVRGGNDDTGVHAPRWHSFLPGMFR